MRHLIIALMGLLLSAPAVGSVVEHTYRFDPPGIESIGDYHLLTFDETYPAGKLGSPMLPFRGIEILLPPGEAVSGVEIEKSDPVTLEGFYQLYPQQPVRPFSDPGPVEFRVDSAIYESDIPLPGNLAPALSTHYANGISIAVGSFTPVTYVPATGTVTYHRSMTVRVHTESTVESRRALQMLPSSERVLKSAAARVDNPGDVTRYAPRTVKQVGEYDYLIITKNTYVDDFQPLADFHNRRGTRTEIKTVEFIDANYSGGDSAERMRACIIDEYQNHGIQWVLLGGDGDGEDGDPSSKVVPYRGLSCIVYSSSTYSDHHIPSDCYFAGLDGTWNDDSDSRWGEPGEEDFYGEVAVARAPVDSEAEIATFITKATRYQDAPVSGEVRDVLLLGEHLWEDPLTWGGDYMDELVGTCTNYGFTTAGIPPAYPIQELYEMDTSWDDSDLMAAVNSGVHFIHHLGHCNAYYAMQTWYTDVTASNFTNNGINHSYNIVFTQGCLGGSFDNYYGGDWYSDDCIAECMLTINTYAAAVIANSRYGWFTEGSTNGPSQHFHREFVDALHTEGITTLGEAVTRCKSETAPFVDLPDEYEPGAHRWCFYCSNALGDAAMDLWTDTPGDLTVTAPESVDRYATSVVVETGVEGALVALSWDGTLYGRAYAGPSGDAELVFSQSIEALDEMDLVVTAHNYLAHEGTILVTDLSSTADEASREVDWALAPCMPNPFSRETAIRYSIRSEADVSLRVFDVTGRTVARLAEGVKPAGRHQVTWMPDTNVAPGIYFCELRAGDFRATRKMLVVR
jgi:hypothetical protein